MIDAEGTMWIPRDQYESFQSTLTYSDVVAGKKIAAEDWKKLNRGDSLRIWLWADESVDVEALRKQGKSEDEIGWIRYPYRAPLVWGLQSDSTKHRWVIQTWQSLAKLVEETPWSPKLPAEMQKPWSNTLSAERQMALWGHANPDVDVPTLMRQANITYQEAVLGKYPYRKTLITLGRPDHSAQIRYRDMMDNRFEDARLEASSAPKSSEATLSPYQQLQQDILEKLFELRDAQGHKGPQVLANALGQSVVDVRDAARSLKRRDLVRFIGVDQDDMISIELTSLGVDRAREGPGSASEVHAGPVYNTTYHGQVANSAVGNSGPTTQIVGTGRTEIRLALDELRSAIADLVDDEEDRDVRVEAVSDLEKELTAEKPRKSAVQKLWLGVGWASTVEGSIQGIERIGRALKAAATYVEPWFDGPPPFPPELMAGLA